MRLFYVADLTAHELGAAAHDGRLPLIGDTGVSRGLADEPVGDPQRHVGLALGVYWVLKFLSLKEASGALWF